jgi:two-component system, OmpR family, KDP operon response regulator KdpE
LATPVIILIDDEPLIRWSGAMLLTRHGYHVKVAATAMDGLALVRASRPDLLLLDRTLPDGDGLRLLQVCQREWPALPVLMVTGDLRPETRAQALRAGAIAVLEKPCDPAVLLAAVADALRPVDPREVSGPPGAAGDAREGDEPESASM